MALLAWYKCDDNAANKTVADASGNSRNGSAYRNTSLWTAAGKVGTGLKFVPASNDRVDCGADFLGTTALTIAAWINLVSWGGTDGGAPGGTGGRIILNGKVYFNLSNMGGAYGSATVMFSSNGFTTTPHAANSALTIDQTWYHVAVTRTAASPALTNFYINGVLSGTADQSSGNPAAGTSNVYVGNSSDYGRGFDGTMDDLRIYNTVLSAAEIKALISPAVPITLLQRRRSAA